MHRPNVPLLVRASIVAALAAALASSGCARGEEPTLRRDAGARDGTIVEIDVPLPVDGGPDAGPCDDLDGDGFSAGGGCTGTTDCDDSDDTVFPGATETCNGVDDDCNDLEDEGFGMEACGVGACATTSSTCVAGVPTTCTPLPAGTETCNGIDDDCNGTADDGFGMPVVCGVGACQVTVPSCSGGTPPTCTPGTPGTETCNLVDDDCNGMVDDGLGTSSCGVGACARTTTNCIGGVPQTCAPGFPGVEACNGIDDNCDGTADEALGTLSCGFGRCATTAPACVGGSPGACVPNSTAARTETCDGIDDDCNAMIDDGIPNLTCGVGACARSVAACVMGAVQSCTPGSPVTEVCGNGIDDNCNGLVDDCVVNETCATATALGTSSASVTVAGTTAGAVHDVTGVCGCTSGSDVFYSFTLAQTEYVYASTFGATWDTSLFFLDSACTPLPARTLPEAVCNDDGGTASCGSLQSQVFAILAAGSYRLAVSGCGSGAFNLTFAHYPVGADGNGGAIAAGASTLTGTLTPGTGVSPAGCGGSGRERSFFWVTCPSAAAGTFSASLCASATPIWDSYLGLHHSNGTSSCDDDACSSFGFSNLAAVPVPAGAGVHVLYVDAFSSGSLSASRAFSAAVTRP